MQDARRVEQRDGGARALRSRASPITADDLGVGDRVRAAAAAARGGSRAGRRRASSSEAKLTLKRPAAPAGLGERELLAVDDVARARRAGVGQQRVDRQRLPDDRRRRRAIPSLSPQPAGAATAAAASGEAQARRRLSGRARGAARRRGARSRCAATS